MMTLNEITTSYNQITNDFDGVVDSASSESAQALLDRVNAVLSAINHLQTPTGVETPQSIQSILEDCNGMCLELAHLIHSFSPPKLDRYDGA